ncbi:MAG: UTRA domain-containing protein [Acetivibrio sp.]
MHENHTPNNVSNLLITLSKFDITSTKITYNYGSPTDIAKVKLNLSESDLVLASNCIYCVKDTVIGYSFIQIPTNFFSVLDLNTADSHSIEDTVTSTVFEYAAASSLTVKLIYANEMEIDFLQVELNTPLILMECILSDKFGSSFCRCKFYFLPEYYHLAFHLTK